MSNLDVEIKDEVQPQADTTVAPVADVKEAEQRYEYQPTDEQGRPIGGRQVIKYKSPHELAEKLAEQNTLLLRKLRAETRKNRLGITEPESIGEDAPRFSEAVSFKPRSLSAEDRVRLSRDLLDPDRFDEASDELFTAKLGVSPVELTKTISELQSERIAQKAVGEANAFAKANPDYVVCQENAEAITNWLVRYQLAPVRANFQRAYETLKAAGILVERPADPEPEPEPEVRSGLPAEIVPNTPTAEVHAEPEVAAVSEETPEPKRAESPKTTSRVPVSLSRSNADDTGVSSAAPAGSDIAYEIVVNGQKRRFTGLAAVDAMPADEYRRRVMTDPSFVKKVEKLEQDKIARRKR